MESVRVSITGIGISSPYGSTLEHFWLSLVSGELPMEKSCLSHLRYENKSSDDYETSFLNSCTTAVSDAFRDARLEKMEKNGCLILGTGMGISDIFLLEERAVFSDYSKLKSKLEKHLQKQTGMQWRTIVIANACCAGAQAIAYGFDLVRSGRYDFVVAGGIEGESEIMQNGFLRLNAIDKECCRPFDKNRKGIRIGEGAAFFVLQRNEKQAYGEILGQAVTNDAYHVVSPRPDGRFAQNAIELALKRAGKKPTEIDVVVAHGTGTKKNDAIEAQVLERIFKNVYVTAPKSVIGHTGGASGAFGLLTALGMLRYQTIPPIYHLQQLDKNMNLHVVQKEPQKMKIGKVLVNCFAFGGTNTVFLCGD